MISWIIIGLSTGNAEVYVDSQVVGQQQGTLTLDDLNTESGTSQWLYTRSLLGYSGKYKTFRYALNLELLNSQVMGTESTLGLDVSPTIFRTPKQNMTGTWILPRDAYVATKFGDWGVQLGIQSFDWGLGILSNSGTQNTRFGINQQGNVYGRLALSRSFDDVRVFWAIDGIVRDESASWTQGDRAGQSIIGVQQIKESSKVGVLTGIRYQQDREAYATPFGPTQSLVVPVDIYATLGLSDTLSIATEGIGVFGQSNRLVNEATQGENATVRYFGGVLRVEDLRETSLGTVNSLLEMGGASGDGDSSDGVARAFSLHSDYNVGLILYDEVLPRVQARSIDRLADPDLSAEAAPGLQHAVPQGGVSNSMYLQLCSTVERDSWLLRAAWLEGFSAVPNIDLYQTALAGGYSTNALGEEAVSRRLGSEVDVRIQKEWKDWVYVGVDAGYFMPNAALPMMEPTTKVLGYVRIANGGRR